MLRRNFFHMSCTRSCIKSFERTRNIGGSAMRAPTTLRKIATVRCVCNAGLHHCNGWKHLQPSVASPSSVGARIARPFISDVITTFRAGARRVIGATAKPLYAIDGKAGGLDRRNPRPPSSREGDRPVGGGRSYQAVEGVQPHFSNTRIVKKQTICYTVMSGMDCQAPSLRLSIT